MFRWHIVELSWRSKFCLLVSGPSLFLPCEIIILFIFPFLTSLYKPTTCHHCALWGCHHWAASHSGGKPGCQPDSSPFLSLQQCILPAEFSLPSCLSSGLPASSLSPFSVALHTFAVWHSTKHCLWLAKVTNACQVLTVEWLTVSRTLHFNSFSQQSQEEAFVFLHFYKWESWGSNCQGYLNICFEFFCLLKFFKK